MGGAGERPGTLKLRGRPLRSSRTSEPSSRRERGLPGDEAGERLADDLVAPRGREPTLGRVLEEADDVGPCREQPRVDVEWRASSPAKASASATAGLATEVPSGRVAGGSPRAGACPLGDGREQLRHDRLAEIAQVEVAHVLEVCPALGGRWAIAASARSESTNRTGRSRPGHAARATRATDWATPVRATAELTRLAQLPPGLLRDGGGDPWRKSGALLLGPAEPPACREPVGDHAMESTRWATSCAAYWHCSALSGRRVQSVSWSPFSRRSRNSSRRARRARASTGRGTPPRAACRRSAPGWRRTPARGPRGPGRRRGRRPVPDRKARRRGARRRRRAGRRARSRRARRPGGGRAGRSSSCSRWNSVSRA